MESQADTAETTLEPTNIEQLQQFLEDIKLNPLLRPVAELALEHYTDELPYHNVDHMFYVARVTHELCLERDITGHTHDVLIVAALWHDADYQQTLGANEVSKEHRSAALASEAILDNPADTEVDPEVLAFVASWVSSLIISTHADHTPADEYEQLLNDADLSNLSGSNIGVITNTVALWLESQLLAGKELVGTVETAICNATDEVTGFCADSRSFLTRLVTAKQRNEVRLAAALKNIPLITRDNMLRVLRGEDITSSSDSNDRTSY